jgi:uroporphyrinogen-III synthase
VQVLVTRPSEDAAPLVDALRERGHDPVLSPLLDIRFEDATAPDLADVQALLFTSANGVRAFARRSDRRDLPALCVGDATARTAQAHGFPRVTTAEGDSAALAATARHALDPTAGALFHAAGTVTAGDLKQRLDAAGFTVRRAALYRAEPATALAAPARAALQAGSLDAALFFSPRTARTFATLARTAQVADACADVTAVCLSPAVADAAAALPWRDVRTAARPETAALLRTLDELAGPSAPAPGEA